MFLAKKRIAIAREDGRVEGHEEGRAEGREERAALAAQIAALTADNERMQEEITRLRNGSSAAGTSD